MRTLRKMKWEEIKGHLAAILPTYTPDGKPQKEFEGVISAFIDNVEDSNILEIYNQTLEHETTEGKD